MMIRQVTPAQDRSADIADKEEALAHLQERIVRAVIPCRGIGVSIPAAGVRKQG
jgi:hypothetical protein